MSDYNTWYFVGRGYVSRVLSKTCFPMYFLYRTPRQPAARLGAPVRTKGDLLIGFSTVALLWGPILEGTPWNKVVKIIL